MCLFFTNLSFCIFLTVIIGLITVIERKILALVQRRVGPDYIGYRGRFQFVADALKLLIKHIEVLFKINKCLFIVIPTTILLLCYFFWVNLVWGYNLNFFEIEYNLILTAIISSLLTCVLFVLSFVTKNKYSILSSYRLLLLTFNIDLLFNFIVIGLVFFFKSFSLLQVTASQDPLALGLFLFLPQLPVLIILFLMESSRIPFDVVEAEAELIAGYTTELGGFFFALLYLAEYFHLYSYAVVYSIILTGGLTF